MLYFGTWAHGFGILEFRTLGFLAQSLGIQDLGNFGIGIYGGIGLKFKICDWRFGSWFIFNDLGFSNLEFSDLGLWDLGIQGYKYIGFGI